MHATGAHFGLAFATAPPIGLALRRTLSRRFMMQKVRPRTFPCGHSARTACKRAISGSFDSPHRGTFHLSLAVLVHYRSVGSI